MKARIIDIKRFAIHDGEGIRATVFFKGCPLSCAWCHNPESIYSGKDIWVMHDSCISCGQCMECPQKAIAFDNEDRIQIDKTKCAFCGYCTNICPVNAIKRIDREVSVEDIIREVEKDQIFYNASGGGVTLSGGEPLMQGEFAIELLKELKGRGFSTCVETSMHCDLDIIKKALNYIDKLFVDIKLLDDEMHRKHVGISNKKILSNFKYLALYVKELEVRIPLIPEITATEKNIVSIRDFVKNINPDIQIELLNYNNLGYSKYLLLGKEYKCSKAEPYSEEEFICFEELVKS